MTLRILEAEKILQDVERLETSFKGLLEPEQRFSISVPRASYISWAFYNFARRIDTDAYELVYKETNAWEAIDNIQNRDYKFGIIRFEAGNEAMFREILESRRMKYEEIASFRFVALMNKEGPLA